MSTVLWANLLIDGKVVSEAADYPALYKHAGKLEALARRLGQTGFRRLCDMTDVRYNLGTLALPEGMESTDELMAKEGVWRPVGEATALLEQLISVIRDRNVRFGLFSNQQADVLEELAATLAYIRAAPASARMFNFSVVT